MALLFVAGLDAVHLGAGLTATPLDAVIIPAMGGMRCPMVRPGEGPLSDEQGVGVWVLVPQS